MNRSVLKGNRLHQRLRSVKFLTLTPLLRRLNILRSDSETFSSFGLQLLLKLQSECFKLFAVSQRTYLVFALKWLKTVSKQIADLCKIFDLFFTCQLLLSLKD